MLLKEIKMYLSEKKQAALDDISFHLKQDKQVVLHGLKLLIQKGIIEEEIIKTPCKSCTCGGTCSGSKQTIYKINP